jgi:hypothetical protein
MRATTLVIAALTALALTATVDAQTVRSASSPAAAKSAVDRLLHAQLHYYFATDQRGPTVTHVAKLNGTNFEALEYGQSISVGMLGFTESGRSVPFAGSEIQGTFKDESITFYGRADGKGRFKSIESVAVVEGTQVTLRNGKVYVYVRGSWKPAER